MAASHMERVLSPRIYQRPAICYVYMARGEINRSNWATIGHDSKFSNRIRDNSLCTLPRSSLLSRVHVFVHEIEIEIRARICFYPLSLSLSLYPPWKTCEIENLFFFPFFLFVSQKGGEGFFWEDFSSGKWRDEDDGWIELPSTKVEWLRRMELNHVEDNC